MKTGKIIKSTSNAVSSDDLKLINRYTRRELNADEVYVFSVVLCDNDIDRDFERFTVEALFELEKLFVGKTGIFDHTPSAKNQTARIFECKVEAVDGVKTTSGDDYFRLVARAYLPKSESNADFILSLDSGILKEVSVGCAVKHTVCSICSNDMNSVSCNHTKGMTYNGQLCFGQLCDVYDAYEFSFVAIPAQKNAMVIKALNVSKKENETMKDILSALKKGEQLSLKSRECESLMGYISHLESEAKIGKLYREQLRESATKSMALAQPYLDTDTIKGIVENLSVEQLKKLCDAYEKNALSKEPLVQLKSDKHSETAVTKSDKNNQFTI